MSEATHTPRSETHIWLTQGQHDLDYDWAVTLSGVTPFGPPFTWIMLSTLTCVLWLSSLSSMFSCSRSTLTTFLLWLRF